MLAFILGTTLGNSYITKYGRLQFDYSSYEYSKWKFDFLFSFNVVSEKIKISTVHRIHPRTKKPSISYRFYSKPCFLRWRNAFYKEITTKKKKKSIEILPKNIENL